MSFSKPSFQKTSLSLAVVAALLYSVQTNAATVGSGQTHTVSSGDAIETWNVNGTLNVTAGAQTNAINIGTGGTATVAGATVTDSARGITLLDGNLAVSGSSITSTNNWGLSLVTNADGSGAGNLVTVDSSSITGVGRGINASSKTDLTLTGTQVVGTGTALNGGVGIAMVGARVNATGSSITGSNNGIVMVNDQASLLNSNTPVLSLDNSQVNGLAGSAISVASLAGSATSATITVANGSTLSGGNGVILEVDSLSSADFSVDNSQLTGDINAASGAAVDVSLANNSSLTGQMTNVTNLAINTGSTWNMVDSASVQNLSMNDGRVNIGGTSAGGFRELTLGSLSGTGTFGLGVAVGENLGDRLNVTGNATGNYDLAITNTGVDPTVGNPLQVVHTGSGDAQFAVIGGKVDVGTFSYLLEKQGNDWFLVPDGTGGGGPIVSPSTRAVIGLFSAAPTVWYGELSTLRSRMGELRNGQDAGGFWMRGYGNKFNMSAGGGVDYSQTQQGISFGVDMPVPDSDGRWLVGLLGGYSNSDLDLQAGTNGEVKSYYVGAYSTWRSVDGYYVDAVIKANRFKNKADVVMSDGVQSKGNYNNNGLGASVEVGKHIDLHDGWFVEPFGQMSTLWVASDNYGLDNGMQARSNGADSYLGKVGSMVGRTIPMDHGGFIQPYVKAAVAHEFAHANKVRVNDNSFSNDLSGSRGELGAGIAAQLTDVLQVHADFDYSNGQNIEQPWGVNVGLRYNF